MVVIFIPLAISVISQTYAPDWPVKFDRLDSPVIDIIYTPGDPDVAEGIAPAGMELGVYLNDSLFTITRADKNGRFSVPLPALPKRVNQLTALPIEIDPSTLLIYYSSSGYQQDRRGVGRPPEFLVRPPFIASAQLNNQNLLIYGSTEPRSDVEICWGDCEAGGPRMTAVTDNEGSFRGELETTKVSPDGETELYARIRYKDDSDWISFIQPVLTNASIGSQPSTPVINRNIHIAISSTDVQLTFVVDMPTGYKVYQNLVQGTISEYEFIRYIFGEIFLNTYFDPRKVAWREEKQLDSDSVRIFVETEKLYYLIPQGAATTFQIDTLGLSSSIPPYSPQDEIIIDLQETHFLSAPLAPTISTQGQNIWRGALAKSPTNLFTVWVSRGGDAVLDRLTRLRLKNTLSNIFAGLPGTYPAPILRQTLEGSLIGLLPANAPVTAQAQVYDFYKDLYLSDPFVSAGSEINNLQVFVRGLPGMLAGSYEKLLFGGLWLIPSLLLILTTMAGEKHDDSEDTNFWLAFTGVGTAVLVILSLDFEPYLQDWISHHTYVTWITAASMMLILGTVAIMFYLLIDSDSTSLRLIIAASLFFLSVGITFGTGFVLFKLPDTWISTLVTSAQLLGWASLSWIAIQVSAKNKRLPSITMIVISILLILGISIPIRALPVGTRLSHNIGVITLSLSQFRPLLPLVVFLAAAFTLTRHFNQDINAEFDTRARRYARVIFVAFVVGLTPSWSYVPISIILSLLLFEWVFPTNVLADKEILESFFTPSIKENKSDEKASDTNLSGRVKAIGDLLELNKASRLRRAVEGSLQKQLREGKLIPEEYYKQKKEHDNQISNLIRPEYIREFDPKITIRDLGFNFGVGPHMSDNVRQALSWGLIFLIPILLLTGIPLLTSDLNDFLPYPIIEAGVRLGLLALQFLASAFFLGFFFPYLRGRNGLGKGGWLASFIIIPLLPIHLLMLDSVTEIPALLIWAGSILTYNLLIGLIAFDIRTLSEFGFQPDRITDMYNFSDIVFYLTGSGTPLITTIVSAIGGGLDELVPAIIKVVFPSVSLEGPQAELLKLLLNLVNQIAGKSSR